MHGNLSNPNLATGNTIYMPDSNYNGSDSFNFKANDGNSNSSIAKVSIEVNPINDPSIAYDDSVETIEDTPVLIPVLNNDIDIDNDILTISETDVPESGKSDISSNNTVIYTPETEFNGIDNFRYTIDDGMVQIISKSQ
jgi:hypothetical protein